MRLKFAQPRANSLRKASQTTATTAEAEGRDRADEEAKAGQEDFDTAPITMFCRNCVIVATLPQFDAVAVATR